MITKGIKQLIAEAELRSKGISVEEARKRIGDEKTVLEFWVDPESPYYKPVFTEDKTFILYCQADWRGTLAAATLGDLGMTNVLHTCRAASASGARRARPRPRSPTRRKPEAAGIIAGAPR